jgi:hypothetical protein
MAISREKMKEEMLESASLWKKDSTEEKALLKMVEDIDTLSDEELKKWSYINQQLISSLMPKETELWKLSNGAEPNWVSEPPDLQKMFNNENILDEWMSMPSTVIKNVAESNGIPYKTLLKELERQSTIKGREDAMFGTNTLQKIFTPRTYEARMRGEDESAKDIGLDVLENVAYMIPYGRIAGMIPKVGAFLKGLGGFGRGLTYTTENAINPALFETIDAVAYDDENNDRSKFSTGDIVQGAGVNMGAPILMKGIPASISRMMGGSGRPDRGLLNKFYDWGDGKTVREIADEVKDTYKTLEKNKQKEKDLLGSLTQEEYKVLESGIDIPVEYVDILPRIAEQKGKNFVEKFENFMKKATDSEKKLISNNPDAKKELLDLYRNSDYSKVEDGKTARELYEEILSKNWTTNKYGDNGYDQSKASTVPAVGYLVNKINEKEKEDLRKKAKSDAIDQYKIRFMLGE